MIELLHQYKKMTTLIIIAILIAGTGWMIRYYDPHN